MFFICNWRNYWCIQNIPSTPHMLLLSCVQWCCDSLQLLYWRNETSRPRTTRPRRRLDFLVSRPRPQRDFNIPVWQRCRYSSFEKFEYHFDTALDLMQNPKRSTTNGKVGKVRATQQFFELQETSIGSSCWHHIWSGWKTMSAWMSVWN